jgi:hypothetical protein
MGLWAELMSCEVYLATLNAAFVVLLDWKVFCEVLESFLWCFSTSKSQEYGTDTEIHTIIHFTRKSIQKHDSVLKKVIALKKESTFIDAYVTSFD